MKKTLNIVFIGLVLASLFALPVKAKPDMTDGFVYPVIILKKVPNENTPIIQIGEKHYSVEGPNIRVPVHATNSDGAGTPPSPHSAPSDTDYMAIWAVQ